MHVLQHYQIPLTLVTFINWYRRLSLLRLNNQALWLSDKTRTPELVARAVSSWTYVVTLGCSSSMAGHLVTNQGCSSLMDGHLVTNQGCSSSMAGHLVTNQGCSSLMDGHLVTNQGCSSSMAGHLVMNQGSSLVWQMGGAALLIILLAHL